MNAEFMDRAVIDGVHRLDFAEPLGKIDGDRTHDTPLSLFTIPLIVAYLLPKINTRGKIPSITWQATPIQRKKEKADTNEKS